VLEQEFRQRLGDAEFEKQYRTLVLQAQEQTVDEEGQVLGVIALIGKTNSQTNFFLLLIWLAKMEAHGPIVREMLEITRQMTIQQLREDVQKALHQEEA